VCPRCGAEGKDIEIELKQMRRADEGMTAFLVCHKCEFRKRLKDDGV